MTDPRQEDNIPPAGVSGNAATIAWAEQQAAATEAGDAANFSADAALDRLIGRINSTSATTPLSALAAPDDTAVRRSGPHEDEALKDYMDQFLERVTGKKKPEGDPGQPVLPAPITPQEPEKTRERSPVSAQNLSLMRELANETARQALGAHAGQAGQRLISATRNSFLGALSLSLVSSLLAVTSLMGEVGWAWTSAVVVMLPALVLTGRFLLLRAKLQKLNACDAASSTA